MFSKARLFSIGLSLKLASRKEATTVLAYVRCYQHVIRVKCLQAGTKNYFYTTQTPINAIYDIKMFNSKTRLFIESNLSQSSSWVITVINASAAVTLLEQRPEKIFRLWAGFEPTTSAMPVQCSSQLSYQSHMRAVVYGLALYMGTFRLGIAEVVCSNPAQSLKIFSGLCSSSVTAALALMTEIIHSWPKNKIFI